MLTRVPKTLWDYYDKVKTASFSLKVEKLFRQMKDLDP
jgi:hypothetical protein